MAAPSPSGDDLGAVARFAHELADLVGPLTLKHFRKPIAVENKGHGSAFDPVTKADRGAEKIIARALAKRFPDHGIIGEEFGSKPGRSDYEWVVDPIDGTRSFICGSPLWGTLIGVLKNKVPFFGLMDQPFTGERYWSGAKSSHLSFRGGKATRIKTRACATLSDAILTTTHPDLFEGGARRRKFSELSRSVRMTRFGGDCYGYCLLAAGHVDLVVESGLKPYDIIALIPIVENAGGVVTTWAGRPATEGGDIIAAGDPRLHAAALEHLAKA